MLTFTEDVSNPTDCFQSPALYLVTEIKCCTVPMPHPTEHKAASLCLTHFRNTLIAIALTVSNYYCLFSAQSQTNNQTHTLHRCACLCVGLPGGYSDRVRSLCGLVKDPVQTTQ